MHLKLCTVKEHARFTPAFRSPCPLLSVPHSGDLGMSHLLLQLENAIHQSLRSRRASRHIDINRHNAVTAPRDTITVVIVTTTISTTAHRNNPSRLGHLIVDLSQRRSHLVRKSTSNDHNVRLARGRSENYTKAILIVTWGREMHHFDSATGKSEGHGPERALSRPVGYLIEGC